MQELFDKTLLPICLQYGLDVFTFWEMTLKELSQFIKALQQKEERKREELYIEASMIANFVGFILNGKPIPPIHKVFPETYTELARKEQEEQDYKAMMLYKEQMLDYAIAVNKRNKAKKDGENKK